MADLTLERIRKLRDWSVGDASEQQDFKDCALWCAKSLLNAAERGLTNGWIKNGPGVEKPDGECVVRTGVGSFCVMRSRDDWWESPHLVANVRHCLHNDDVTHFMPIKEPTDADR